MKTFLSALLFAVLFPFLAQTALGQTCGNNSRNGISCPCPTCPCPGVSSFDPYTGNVEREIEDLKLWGSVGDVPMVWSHYYTSRGNILWNYSFVYSMYDGATSSSGQPTIVIDYPEGGEHIFTRSTSNPTLWLSMPGVDRQLFQSGTDYYLQLANGFRYHFGKFSLVIGSTTYFYYLLVDISDSKQNVYTLTYNASRKLISVTEPGGRYFQINYVTVGGRPLIGSVNTSDGRTVTYQYDIYNDGVSKWIRFTGATYGDATTATYTYTQLAPGGTLRLDHAIDPRYHGQGVNMTYTYDWYTAAGYVKEEKNGVNGQLMSTLSATDSTRTVCYPNGKQEVFLMPANMLGSRKSYTDGLGRVTRYTYDNGGQGYKTNDTDALNRVTTYTSRSVYGNVLGVKHHDGTQESWTRDNLDRILTHTDELGRVTTYTRDANHRVTRIDYPDATFETYTYNGFGEVLDHRKQNAATEHYAYDSRGLMTSYQDAIGNTTSYTYDGSDRPITTTDARGNTTSYQYNERGELIKKTNPDLTFQTYTYDTYGDRTSTTDELNHTWSTTYDEFRRPLTNSDPLSRTTQYTYDLPGGVCGCAHEKSTPTAVTLPSGKITRFTYDVEWQLSSEKVGANSPDSAITYYEYDMVGNLTKVTDPRGKDWKNEYDARDRRTATVDPLGHRTEWTYDAVGNTLTEKRPDNGITANVYDVMDRPTKSTDPKSQVTQYSYDADGNLTTLTDPKGNVNTYQYDALDRRTKTIYPGGGNEQHSYDAVGNMVTVTNRTGAVCTFTYDNRDRTTLSNWSDATPDVTYTYDAASRLLTTNNSTSNLTYTYDNANELITQTQNISGSGGGGKVTTYTYDADGLCNTMTYPGGTVVTYKYTGRDQLDSIADGSTPAVVNYNYDPNGNIISKTLKNGTVTTYSYDDDSRNLTVDHKLSSTTFSRYDYGYDNVHRRTFMQRDLAKGDVYTYDPIDQVTGVQYDVTNPGGIPSSPTRTVSYTYDADGNRTNVTDNSVPTAYNSTALNQYSSVGGNAFTYNTNGDLVTQNGWTYTYDAQNRMTGASNSSNTATYSYDGLNRCVKRIDNGVTTYLYYDGWSLIEERDASDALQQTYIQGATTDEIISKTSGANTVYYHYDALGSVTRLTNSSGAVVEQYFYDVFGNPTIKNGGGSTISATAFTNRFLYGGREYLADIDLYDYRNRMYSANIGRFLQPDPIGFNGGDYNLYRYVMNGVLNWLDWFGLQGTLTIHSDGTTGIGNHSWISFTPDRTGVTTTYGTWGNNPNGLGNGLHEGLEDGRGADASRTMHITAEQEAALFKIIEKYRSAGEEGWTYGAPCSSFAADSWNEATGECLSPHWGPISNPATLTESIINKNGGVANTTVPPNNGKKPSSGSSSSSTLSPSSSSHSSGSFVTSSANSSSGSSAAVKGSYNLGRRLVNSSIGMAVFGPVGAAIGFFW